MKQASTDDYIAPVRVRVCLCCRRLCVILRSGASRDVRLALRSFSLLTYRMHIFLFIYIYECRLTHAHSSSSASYRCLVCELVWRDQSCTTSCGVAVNETSRARGSRVAVQYRPARADERGSLSRTRASITIDRVSKASSIFTDETRLTTLGREMIVRTSLSLCVCVCTCGKKRYACVGEA